MDCTLQADIAFYSVFDSQASQVLYHVWYAIKEIVVQQVPTSAFSGNGFCTLQADLAFYSVFA